MRKFMLGLGLLAVFGVGCVAGATQLGVPKAKAASEAPRWAYFCFDAASTEDLHEKANAAGASGWEMVSGVPHTEDGGQTWCFRRTKS